jgi:hypothetical protein
MDDFIEMLFFMVVLLVLVFVGVIGLGYVFTSASCNAYESATGKQTKMQFLDCYIQEDGKWYVWEEYKYRFVTKGEM